MVLCEAIIANDDAINAETDTLEVISPTSLTIRADSYGAARITHAMGFTDTDDVNSIFVVPSGYSDSNGFEIPYIEKFLATNSFDLRKAKLPMPIPVPNSSDLAISATSETAANTVVYVWLWVEYAGKGEYVDITPPSEGGMTVREINAGGALTSDTAADGTTITDLQAGRIYQPMAISGVGVEGQTAGIVGPAFVRFKGPSEFAGIYSYVPLANALPYSVEGGVGKTDLMEAGIKMPRFKAPNELTPEFLGYTAEQPEGRLILAVDKVYP